MKTCVKAPPDLSIEYGLGFRGLGFWGLGRKVSISSISVVSFLAFGL